VRRNPGQAALLAVFRGHEHGVLPRTVRRVRAFAKPTLSATLLWLLSVVKEPATLAHRCRRLIRLEASLMVAPLEP
ncbi:hypothetical protein, partial [Klebsiella variicola]|uniref:hypothetical protein n=1 Tax=Klebsiella variicola TaxID=244366 RepID=UPI00276D9D83|nr:hypothetical protein [Klebsiella variicola]